MSDRYQLESRIATGGMGEIWRATDRVLGREVAVKLLKAEYADDPTFRTRFEAEARNAAALHHPNVASVFDVSELTLADEDPRPFLVMELVRGEPLSDLLRHGEPMPPDTATNLLAQAADGLAAAHDLGIVHRDVKPANLLVTPDRTVKITDFGIARAADSVALTQTGQVIGTPQYLSPEQAEGRSATPASDVYSLGVVLFECLAGRRPFEADSPIATALAHLREQPPELPAHVPLQLRRTVAVALAKDPADRFASMRDFADALRGAAPPTPGRSAPAAVAAEAPTRVVGPATGVLPPTSARPPADAPDSDDDPARRTPAWVLWVAAAVAVLVVVVVLAWLSNRGADQTDTPQDTTTSSPSASASQRPSTTAPTPSDTPAPSASSSAPDQVTVTASNYLGQPADQVRSDLEGLGLKVTQRPVDNPGGKQQGTVSDVSPSGRVDRGSSVTVSVYGPTPSASPTPPTNTPTSSPAPGSSTPAGGDDGGDQ